MGFWSFITGTDLEAEQERSNNLDAQLAAMNQQDLLSGKYDQSTFNQAEANRKKSYADEGGANLQGEVSGAFDQSINENTTAIRKGLTAVITEPLKIGLKLIPWPVYVAAVLFLFFYLGGALWIRKLIPKPK
jgi:hypothetical protein